MEQEGALFVTAEECLQATSAEVPVHSTVGAGDALVAGFVAGSLRGWSLADCARLATASALGALTQAVRRLPPTPAIESLMAQVSVRPVVEPAGHRLLSVRSETKRRCVPPRVGEE